MEGKEIVSKLFDISLKIYEYYQKLKELDYYGKKDSIDYQNNMSILNELLNEEKNIYESINDRDLIQNILLYLSNKKEINNLICDIKALISNNMIIIKRRIIIRLLNKKQDIDKETLLKMALELDDDAKDNNIKIKENSYYKLNNLLKLSESIKMDFINSILLIINNNKDIKRDVFLNLLYNTSYLFEFCEKELLRNNFEIKDIYWISELVTDLNKINDEEFQHTKELFGIEIYNYFKDRKNEDLIKIILRVSLLFCKEEELKNIGVDINISNNDRRLVKSIRVGDKHGEI